MKRNPLSIIHTTVIALFTISLAPIALNAGGLDNKFGSFLKQVTSTPTPTSESTAPSNTTQPELSKAEMDAGLQLLLEKMVSGLDTDTGNNPTLSQDLSIPESIKKMAANLSGPEKEILTQNIDTSLTEAKGLVMEKAPNFLKDSLSTLNFDKADSASILQSNQQNSATLFLEKNTRPWMSAQLKPYVASATEKTGAAESVEKLKAAIPEEASTLIKGLSAKMGGGEESNFDVNSYLNNKTLDAVYKVIAEQEVKIRNNPAIMKNPKIEKLMGKQ
jgi:hypothetical protein